MLAKVIVSVGLACLASVGANAAQRTFVASYGSDLNPCTIGAPCRSFATALTQTDDAGEIIVVDSAGYGAVAIAQSVSIIAPAGVYAGITVFDGTGIAVDGPQIKVTLHGLNVNGQGAPTAGIAFVQGSTLRVERCVVSNTTQDALDIAATGGKSFVADSVFRDAGSTGINIRNGEAVLERVRSENNFGEGIRVDPSGASPVQVSIRDSVAIGSRFWGYVVFADATLQNNVSEDNVSGPTVGVLVNATFY